MHLTREQASRIESLANDFGKVEVNPVMPDGTVTVTAGGLLHRLDEDGDDIGPDAGTTLYVPLSIDLLVRMLGEDVVRDAFQSDATFAELGTVLVADVKARIAELLATSETVAEESRPAVESARLARKQNPR